MTNQPMHQIESDLRKWMKSSNEHHYIQMVVHNWVCPKSKKTPYGIVTEENVALLKQYFRTPLYTRKITNLGVIRTYTPWNLVRLTWKRPLPPLTSKSPTKSTWVVRGRFKSRVGTAKYKIKTLHRPRVINIH